jgi:hypothetical protein
VTEIWDVKQLSPGRRRQTQEQLDERSRYTEAMLIKTLAALKAMAEGRPAAPPQAQAPPSAPWQLEEDASMPCRSRPEAKEEPPRGDTAQCLRTIERWLHHAEEEILYAPDAAEEVAATPLDSRYYLRWGSGGLGVLAILRFPMDTRHPLTQQPYGAYTIGEVFPVMYQGQWYQGRVIERLVSRADGLVELHVQAVSGEEPASEGAPR